MARKELEKGGPTFKSPKHHQERGEGDQTPNLERKRRSHFSWNKVWDGGVGGVYTLDPPPPQSATVWV